MRFIPLLLLLLVGCAAPTSQEVQVECVKELVNRISSQQDPSKFPLGKIASIKRPLTEEERAWVEKVCFAAK